MLTPRSLPNTVELDADTTLKRWSQFIAWVTAPERIDDCQVFFVQDDEPDFWQNLGHASCGRKRKSPNEWFANRFYDFGSDPEFLNSIVSDCHWHDEECSVLFAFDDASDAALFKLTWLGV